ncbi:MAG: hypothetical protein EBU31_12185, partial [Proteobacteria bacterium]|nr:hypothetical protein [Pseudomonadota bacterium]
MIAFPYTAVLTNNTAVMAKPGNDVISGLSATGYNSMKCIFGCQLLNYNYFGPVMLLRASNSTSDDRYTANFYADVCGNLGTGYLGTGMSVKAWLASVGANTTYAYVGIWYNQCTSDPSSNHAYQFGAGSQPIYDVSFGCINFGYTGTAGGVAAPNTNNWFNIKAGALPFGDASYSYVLKTFNIPNYGGIVFGGKTTTNQGLFLGITSDALYSFNQNWYNSANFNVPVSSTNSYAIGSQNAVVSALYTSGGGTNSQVMVINGTKYYSSPGTTRNQDNGIAGNNYIGRDTSYYPNCQLYYLYVSKIALSDADRALLEATPNPTPNYRPMSAGVVTYAQKSNTIGLTWPANPSVASYDVYIENIKYTSTTNASSLLLTNLPANMTSYRPWHAKLALVGYDSNGNVISNVGFASYATNTAPLLTYTTQNFTVTSLKYGSSNYTDASGQTVSNNALYYCYTFTQTASAYTLSYTLQSASYIYVL